MKPNVDVDPSDASFSELFVSTSLMEGSRRNTKGVGRTVDE